LVHYSHDWQEEIGCISVPYRRDHEAPLTSFHSKVGVLVLRKNYYMLSLRIDDQKESRVSFFFIHI